MKKFVVLLLILTLALSPASTIYTEASATEKTSVTKTITSTDASKYFYNQLNKNGKTLYRYLYKHITKKNIDKSSELHIKKSKFSSTVVKEMPYLITKVWAALIADHPKLKSMAEEPSWQYSKKKKQLTFSFDTLWASSYMQKKAEKILDSWAASINPTKKADRYTKFRRIWYVMSKNISYDTKGLSMDLYDRAIMYMCSIISPAIYGDGVCEGYQYTFKYLCDKVGIPCIIVGNYSHGWNLIQMEDGKWYNVDTTGASEGGYTNQLLGSADERFKNTIYTDGIWYLYTNNGDFSFPTLSKTSYQYKGKETGFKATPKKVSYSKKGKFIYRKNADGTYTLKDYQGNSNKTIKIPSTYKGKKITVIGEGAFYRCNIKGTVKIPSTVEKIELCAFARCKNITNVRFSKKLKRIEASAFAGCSGLKGKTVKVYTKTKIVSNAFKECGATVNKVKKL